MIHQAQSQHNLPEFDLIICDEAHRTTGATFDGEDESAFVRIHDADYIKGAKRLYMTATPRIYGEAAKQPKAWFCILWMTKPISAKSLGLT